MKKRLLTYSTLCGTGLLFACASPPPMSTLAVKPAMNVSSVSERPDGYYQLGRYYEGQNRLDQAIDAYRKALALDRNFVDVHNALGAIYAQQGRLDEAVVEFNIVVAALPVTSYAWNNLGYAYLLQGKSADAIVALERATAFDLTNQRAWNNLGTALAQRGEAVAANEKFARAAELAAAVPASPAALPAATPDTSPAATPAATPDGSPAVSPAAAPVVAVLTAAPPNAGDRVPLDKPAEASAPIQLGPQPSTFADSAKETGSVVTAVVDNTGAGELIQLAPSVYELRLAAVPSAAATPQAIAAQGFRLELSNGSGVTGMAKRLGEQLAAIGLPKPRLTNQKPFRQRVTEIQYRDGYADVAASLRSRMPSQPPMIMTVALRASTDVRVVLGRDLPHDVALLEEPATGPMQFADAAQDLRDGTE